MTDFCDDLENWMGKMPAELKAVPIINLAIPGSHDTMSYGIKSKAPVAPDADPVVGTLNKYIPCVVKRWAVTQRYDIVDQLKCGVRYFDLRICMKRPENKFYFVHGLFCEEIAEPLDQLKDFLRTHPREFVVLDCQHFYLFNPTDHCVLSAELNRIFDKKIYSRDINQLKDCTLESATRNGKQILIVYRSDACVNDRFWLSQDWPTPWPNEVSVKKLRQYLEETLTQRSPEAGHVSQCVLTPSVRFIVPRFMSSLRATCAKEVDRKLMDWIRQQVPGPFGPDEKPKSNVFLADFVDIQDSNFCRVVVELNKKILDQGSTSAQSSPSRKSVD
ncbi:glycosylphosphatidylinositol-specific phospholipase C [Culex quinquefasciatus]|uniref:Glycosylphosphatidylinositol-specific phospholipase C n=1 Tax=Culex quinquefasciatus TaxID=7176 RepID=B0WPF7_CULQU|nr:PI-PLC X domain-containing protein 2 [Culex quinquefasciatus]XP_039431944.1 PI-PLC X domain-containing protein 2 [Culex pipiens pallens]EDS32336.1 glycosylphosphatidylinositol-specific phospholipase C [Culex quinquefasciatus]|eukprot:XP_001850591.1 glycosylphosphatidylinositol-specific phospholipase C [Culex quinquefasciatus]